jgi:hypothetical protein
LGAETVVVDRRTGALFSVDAAGAEALLAHEQLGEAKAWESLRRCRGKQMANVLAAELRQLEAFGLYRPGLSPPERAFTLPDQAYIVLHVHWDPEWYLDCETTLARGMALVDNLLHALSESSFQVPVYLDGACLLLEQYLELRPEQTDLVKRLVASGRLSVGPWYVQTDPFSVDGECLARNLALGLECARRWGHGTLVGYFPDTCGNVSQMPQVLNSFGISEAVMYRGVPAEAESLEMVWTGADGSKVLLLRLPGGFNMLQTDALCDLARCYGDVEALLANDVVPRSASRVAILLMHCVTPLTEVGEKLAALAGLLSHDVQLEYATIEQAATAVRRRMGRVRARVSGELRDCRHACIHPGVASARSPSKALHKAAQRELVRWAEPWSAIVGELGGPDLAPLTERAWKLLLQSQNEDAVRGCVVDSVHLEQEVRLRKVSSLASSVASTALGYIASRIPRGQGGSADEAMIVVFNPLPWARSGVVQAEVEMACPPSSEVVVIDDGGNLCPSQAYASTPEFRVDVAPVRRPRQRWATMLPVAFQAEELPPLGYRAYRVHATACAANRPPSRRNGPELAIENEYFRVVARKDGTLDLEDTRGGRVWENVLSLEDSGDMGDLYTYCPPLWDEVVTSPGAAPRVALVDEGPCRQTLRVDYDMRLPDGLTPEERVPEDALLDGLPEEALAPWPGPTRTRRSKRRTRCHVSWSVALQSGGMHVEVGLHIENRVKDHRLRCLVRSGIVSDVSFADTPFDIVERPVQLAYPMGRQEESVNTHPLASLVGVEGDQGGLLVCSPDIAEYEVLRSPAGAVALTLLRCVEWLNRDNLTTRDRHLAPTIATPLAQCQGTHGFRLYLLPYEEAEGRADVLARAQECLAPLRAVAPWSGAGPAPKLAASDGFLAVEPRCVVLSALRKSRGGAEPVVRLHNPTAKRVRTCLTVSPQYSSAQWTDLGERALEREPTARASDGKMRFVIAPRGIATLRLLRSEDARAKDTRPDGGRAPEGDG